MARLTEIHRQQPQMGNLPLRPQPLHSSNKIKMSLVDTAYVPETS
jgi:hypothetical protein